MLRSSIAAILLTLVTTVSAQAPPRGRSVGPLLAKVTIDVYSDFQCPHCKALAETTLNRVEEDYAAKGMIRLVHHDFPLPTHAYARQAALFAAAAEKVGKFEQVSTALFKDQDIWGANGKVEETVDRVLTPSEAKQVHQLVGDPSIAAIVQRDIDLGTRMQITSTPTIFITKDLKSNRITGNVSYSILKRYIDQLLAE